MPQVGDQRQLLAGRVVMWVCAWCVRVWVARVGGSRACDRPRGAAGSRQHVAGIWLVTASASARGLLPAHVQHAASAALTQCCCCCGCGAVQVDLSDDYVLFMMFADGQWEGDMTPIEFEEDGGGTKQLTMSEKEFHEFVGLLKEPDEQPVQQQKRK